MHGRKNIKFFANICHLNQKAWTTTLYKVQEVSVFLIYIYIYIYIELKILNTAIVTFNIISNMYGIVFIDRCFGDADHQILT